MPPMKKARVTSNKATALSKATAPATPQTSSPGPSKKRKIDWATIDDKEPFQGFGLRHIKATKSKKKQKASSGTNAYKDAPLDAKILQKNPFVESELSETQYLVEPAAEWESTLRYRKFTISDAEFEVGQIVFIAKTEEAQDTEDAIPNWLGRILEVRAGDASHVYLRVYWLYRPEDLPQGRQPHHGDSELIASNHMDIIEALTVADKADVVHWDEDPDSDWPMRDQLFWRQTFDIEKPKAKQFSELRKFCVDEAPCNPDELLIECKSCSGWLHAHCLEDQAVQDALDEHMPATKGKKTGGRKSSTGISFSAALTTVGPDNNNTLLIVTDERPSKKLGSWTVDVNCLLCHALIEKAATNDLPRSEPKSKSKGKGEDITIPEVARPGTGPLKDEDPAQDLEDALTPASNPPNDILTDATLAASLPPKDARGCPPKRERKSSPTEIEVQKAAVKDTETVLHKTPEQAAVHDTATVFQSGIRGVKRLFIRGA